VLLAFDDIETRNKLSFILEPSMSASAEAQAQEYIDQAVKTLNSFRLFNKAAKFEEASELYAKAAAQYKIAKAWQEAGDCYVKAAENANQSNNPHDALNHYTNAAKCYKNGGNKSDAIRMYEVVVQKQQENNKFSVAAKLYKEIAEMEEADMKIQDAADAYQKAADCFQADDANTTANQMLIKVADLCAMQDDFRRAIQIYEQVAAASADNNLTRWSCTEYLFKAALCQLALSAKQGTDRGLLVKDTLDRYKDMNAQFEQSRECKFMEKVVQAYEDKNEQDFTDVVAEYDELYKLDKWKSTLLLYAKNSLSADHEEDLR
jgi:alpha-soluble NSF attachment protein